jgi:hypothetical protein
MLSPSSIAPDARALSILQAVNGNQNHPFTPGGSDDMHAHDASERG